MSTIAPLKNLIYFVKSSAVVKLQTNAFTNKKWGGFKYFYVFNKLLFKQILLRLVLWNK